MPYTSFLRTTFVLSPPGLRMKPAGVTQRTRWEGALIFRVLLVDDEKMALVSTRHSFDWEKYGFFDVRETENPLKALEMLETQRFDAVFVDIRMPEVSGLELMERMQGTQSEFIVLTGYSDFEYARAAIKLRAFDYCLKPVQPEESAPLLSKLKK